MKEQELIVMKFGGKSVEDAEGFINASKIIKDYSRNNQIVVVVSAIYGVTNQLFEFVEDIKSKRQRGARNRINDLYESHIEVANSLGLLGQRPLTGSLHRFRTDLLSFALSSQLKPSQEDFIVSSGERLSYLLLSEAANKQGVPSQPVDAANVIATNNEYGNAKADIKASWIQAHHYLRPLLVRSLVPIIGGFYGFSQEGQVAILGRGGSDYSAAILANILGAKKLILWKEVDGIYSADPKKNPYAKFLPEVSYDQAEDLTRYKGAKILHPEAIDPLRAKNIPIEVKNFNNPDADGSIVTGNYTYKPEKEDQASQSFWLERVIKPELINLKRILFATGDASIEFMLINELVSARTDIKCDDITKRRLNKLLRLFPQAAYQNMLPREQQLIDNSIHSKETTGVDDKTIEAIKWIWRTFDLQIPQTAFPFLHERGIETE